MQSSMLRQIVEDFGNGGTIDGDLTISGDLTVSGGGSLSFDEILEGTQVIDVTSTEAFLVRKNSDGGDVFVVDTTNSSLKMGGNLTFTHDIATISSTTGLLQLRILETGQDMLFDAGGDFKFRDTDDSNATRVTIQSGSGNVGIGTASPSGTDIDGTVLEIKDSTNNVGLNINATNTGKAAMIELHADRPSDGNLSGNLQFFNNGATQIAEIRALRGSTDLKGHLALRTSDTNRLYIDEDGLVGIGTASPTAPLTITTDTSPAMIIEDAAGHNQFQFNINASTGAELSVNDGGGTERIRLSGRSGGHSYITNAGAGYFGIGTTAPSKLMTLSADVSGETQQLLLVNKNDTDGDTSGILFGVLDDATYAKAGIFFERTAGQGRGSLHFATDNATDSGQAVKSDARMTIDATGSVGIGTTSPSSFLHISNSAASTYALKAINTSTQSWGAYIKGGSDSGDPSLNVVDKNDNPLLYVRGDGNVGIGISTMESAGGGVSRLQVEGTTHETSSVSITRNANSANAGYLTFSKSRGASVNSDTIVQDDDAIGSILFAPADGTDRNSISASIQGSIDGTPGSNDVPGRLVFSTTADGAATVTERMRIDSSGRVGIGTDNPSSQDGSADNLVIEAASGNVGITIKTATTAVGAIHFSDGTSGADTYRGMIAYKHGDEEMRFRANAVQVMVIDANSRISLTNNDSGGTGGSDGLSANTIFGYLAGEDIADGGVDNTYFGHKAGSNNATGDDNVFMGSNAGKGAHGSSNSSNVGIGSDSMLAVTTGGSNVAIGKSAAVALTTGDSNITIGTNTLGIATSAEDVVLIGASAGYAINNDSADGTVAVGRSSLAALTSGGKNVAVGFESGKLIQTGERNTILGYQAGITTVDVDSTVIIGNYAGASVMTNAASGTVAIGKSALAALTSGGTNTAVGYQALMANTIGHENTALGYKALLTNVDGDSNTAIGMEALKIYEPADGVGGNTAVGYQAGDALTTGNSNTLIGRRTDASAVGGVNQTVIGNEATGVADNSVTLGNADVTDVYMASDSGATVHALGLKNTGVKAYRLSGSKSVSADTLTDLFTVGHSHNYTITLWCWDDNSNMGQWYGHSQTNYGANTMTETLDKRSGSMSNITVVYNNSGYKLQVTVAGVSDIVYYLIDGLSSHDLVAL